MLIFLFLCGSSRNKVSNVVYFILFYYYFNKMKIVELEYIWINKQQKQNKVTTSELALEYMISSALSTTTGSFSWYSLFFLVAEPCISFTTLFSIQQLSERERIKEEEEAYAAMHKKTHIGEIGRGKTKMGGPENFLNESSSDGLVSFTVPSSSHTIIRSRTWPWHPEAEKETEYSVSWRETTPKLNNKRATCAFCFCFPSTFQKGWRDTGSFNTTRQNSESCRVIIMIGWV